MSEGFLQLKKIAFRVADDEDIREEILNCHDEDDVEFLLDVVRGVRHKLTDAECNAMLLQHLLGGDDVEIPLTDAKQFDVNKLKTREERKTLERFDVELAKHCAMCGIDLTEKIGRKCCGGCKNQIYCNEECQRKHWKEHKLVCQKNC